MKHIFNAALAAVFSLLSAAALAAVDVNKANQAELESIKGIGPSMSAKILEARKTGSFKDWQDMQSRVKGVRNATSVKFSSDGLTVNGSPYTGGADSTGKASGKKSAQAAAGDAAPKAVVAKAK